MKVCLFIEFNSFELLTETPKDLNVEIPTKKIILEVPTMAHLKHLGMVSLLK